MNPTAINNNACPIFAKRENRVHFAGSAFFFRHGEDVLVCTADHVIAAHPESAFEIFPIGHGQPIDVEIIERNADLDLCTLRPSALPDGEVGLALSDQRETAGNISLYVYEFSTTRIVEGQFFVNPATRIGNCVRLIQRDDIFNGAGRDMLELSFPAIRGASGSAVIEIRQNQMIVHGILVANTEHHLLPAHIETVLDEENEILEERKYFLPQGAAVNSIHLLSILN